MTSEQPKKVDKRKALMSFLQTTQIEKESEKRNSQSSISDAFDQQYTQSSNCCTVCSKQMHIKQSKKHQCGFCEMKACKQHLRKYRVKNRKWQRICDNCQDNYIFDIYMKMQKKAQEALLVKEQIIKLKHNNIKQILENKQVKRRELSFFQAQLIKQYQSQIQKIEQQQHKFQSISNKIESTILQSEQLQEYIKRMENKIKENYQEDYDILGEQSENLGKQLTRAQKKCLEVRNAIEKRQKQLEEAYDKWQRKQYQKSARDGDQYQGKDYSKQKCRLF